MPWSKQSMPSLAARAAAKMASLERWVAAKLQQRRVRIHRPDLTPYRLLPVEYARDILGMDLTPDQQVIIRSLLEPPCRTMVPAGHAAGKTALAAAACNWWYDTRDPAVIITTAPTQRDVVDLLWTEIRLQRQRAKLPLPDDFTGPKAPVMFHHEEHYAKGFTAVKGESFQGRHRRNMLFIKDEAVGVDGIYWTTTNTMFDPELGHAELNIYNPTDTTSQAYQEENLTEADGTPRRHVIRLSALNHPNVLADLGGKTRPVPGAVNKAMVDEWVKDWCEPIRPEDARPGLDLEWPPGSGSWHRPGPLFQSRVIGVWPESSSGVWSDALFESCLKGSQPPFPLGRLPQVGVDCATGKGDDYVGIHATWGAVSVHHETSNTMEPVTLFKRVKAVCADMAALANKHRPNTAQPVRPQQVPVAIDDDGVGHTLTSFLKAEGYTVFPVSAASSAARPADFPNKRSEIWFQAAAKAKTGQVWLGLLDRPTQRRLKQQLMAPEWEQNPAGQRVVEPKAVTKRKIGRSPDDADAFNLSRLELPASAVQVVTQPTPASRYQPRGPGNR
jgi:hypothetical protein